MTRSASALLLVLSVAAVACRPSEPAASVDTRIALALPDAEAHAVRTEMRTMLTSLQAILAALPLGDSGTIRSAATAAGMQAAADTALEGLLPEQFLQLGSGTHQVFDSLAAAVGRGLARDSIVERRAGSPLPPVRQAASV